MAKFEYAIPDDLSESERDILDAKRSACFDSIHGVSLRSIHVTDDRGRSIFRLTNYSRPTECYFEATIGQIDTLDDHNFKNAIVTNERPCSNDE
jgi:hypothetical protein